MKIHMVELTSGRLGWFALGFWEGARRSRMVVGGGSWGAGVDIGAGPRSSWVGRGWGWGSGYRGNTDDSRTCWGILQRQPWLN